MSGKKYSDFWSEILTDFYKQLNPAKELEYRKDIKEIKNIGDRGSTYNGYLEYWAGYTNKLTDSSVFRNLRDEIRDQNRFNKNVFGYAEFRIKDTTLTVNYKPLNYENIIWWYKHKIIPTNHFKDEKYKWVNVQNIQNAWDKYQDQEIDFKSFYSAIEFSNLIFHNSRAVIDHVVHDLPSGFEKLLNNLYDESEDLANRITQYQKEFKEIYFSLENHGKKTFQEERTIATLLTYRYPERYTLYKDSFYTNLCKGLGIKPKKAGEKLLHYYELVNEFLAFVNQDKELVNWKNEKLDENCYLDENNLILAQDILYRSLSNPSEPETEEYDEGSDITNEFSDLNINMEVMPLNQILFGPPGTGKTYNTINKALELLKENIEGKSRKEIKALYDKKIEEGQIVFTTFHQSMSYEDFVEGIKPVSVDGSISYEIEPGIFYKICKKAQRPTSDNFDNTYDKLINEIKKEGSLVLETLVHSKEFTVYVNSKDNLKFHANTEKAYEGVIKKDIIEKYLKEGLVTDWSSYTKSVARYMEEELGYSQKEDTTNNFVLIIDEINRGNVSSIFGELITLIEEDKRDGGKEALEVELPYSKKSFKVPSNVYILGTMNTADRSVEALDTALRRRFTFTEMAPDSMLLSPQYMIWRLFWEYADAAWDDQVYKPLEDSLFDLLQPSKDFTEKSKYSIWTQWEKEGENEKQVESLNEITFTGLNLQKLLDTINSRIEKLIDKDHKIGHSYFINVRSIKDLKLVFKDKVVPLLEEYFFGDFGKIGLVLGKSFIEKEESEEFDFADFEDYDNYIKEDLSKRATYRIKHSSNWDFKSIYDAIQK